MKKRVYLYDGTNENTQARNIFLKIANDSAHREGVDDHSTLETNVMLGANPITLDILLEQQSRIVTGNPRVREESEIVAICIDVGKEADIKNIASYLEGPCARAATASRNTNNVNNPIVIVINFATDELRSAYRDEVTAIVDNKVSRMIERRCEDLLGYGLSAFVPPKTICVGETTSEEEQQEIGNIIGKQYEACNAAMQAVEDQKDRVQQFREREQRKEGAVRRAQESNRLYFTAKNPEAARLGFYKMITDYGNALYKAQRELKMIDKSDFMAHRKKEVEVFEWEAQKQQLEIIAQEQIFEAPDPFVLIKNSSEAIFETTQKISQATNELRQLEAEIRVMKNEDPLYQEKYALVKNKTNEIKKLYEELSSYKKPLARALESPTISTTELADIKTKLGQEEKHKQTIAQIDVELERRRQQQAPAERAVGKGEQKGKVVAERLMRDTQPAVKAEVESAKAKAKNFLGGIFKKGR